MHLGCVNCVFKLESKIDSIKSRYGKLGVAISCILGV